MMDRAEALGRLADVPSSSPLPVLHVILIPRVDRVPRPAVVVRQLGCGQQVVVYILLKRLFLSLTHSHTHTHLSSLSEICVIEFS